MIENHTILVTTDFSEPALKGVRTAAEFAAEIGSRIVLLYVAENRLPPMMFGSALHLQALLDEHKEKATETLKEYAAEHLAGVDVKTRVESGKAAPAIVRVADEEDANVIVMSTHGFGFGFVGQVLLGSTTERVLRHAKRPVLVVPTAPD